MYFDNRNQDAKPTTKGEKIFTLVFSLVVFTLFTLEIFTNYEPKKLGALLFVIFWIQLLAIHELGHAIMAQALGWKVNRIVLGVGKIFTVRRWFGAPVEIRSILIEGFVQIAPKTSEKARYKHALIYFAGPGIELVCFCIIAMMFGGFESLFTMTNDYGRIALQSFAFAALFGAVLNLIPQGISTKDGDTPNDGMGILLCLFASNVNYEQWIEESREDEEVGF